jgi:hypothetical protein
VGEMVMWSTPARDIIWSIEVRLAGRTLVLTWLVAYRRWAWTHKFIALLWSTKLVVGQPLSLTLRRDLLFLKMDFQFVHVGSDIFASHIAGKPSLLNGEESCC